MAKVYTESELDLKELNAELKEFDKQTAKDVKELAAVRKHILADIARAEKTVAKEKTAKGKK